MASLQRTISDCSWPGGEARKRGSFWRGATTHGSKMVFDGSGQHTERSSFGPGGSTHCNNLFLTGWTTHGNEAAFDGAGQHTERSSYLPAGQQYTWKGWQLMTGPGQHTETISSLGRWLARHGLSNQEFRVIKSLYIAEIYNRHQRSERHQLERNGAIGWAHQHSEVQWKEPIILRRVVA